MKRSILAGLFVVFGLTLWSAIPVDIADAIPAPPAQQLCWANCNGVNYGFSCPVGTTCNCWCADSVPHCTCGAGKSF